MFRHISKGAMLSACALALGLIALPAGPSRADGFGYHDPKTQASAGQRRHHAPRRQVQPAAPVPNPAPPQAEVVARIKPTIWIDPDGCMHWAADGGWEGYMVERVNPRTGMPVCLQMNTCLVENTDALFATDSHNLTRHGRERLSQFFRTAGATAYAVYGHTDSRASDEYNMRLSDRRARTVANLARSQGAHVARELGFGERVPVATNATAEGMQRNRRVEIVCYR